MENDNKSNNKSQPVFSKKVRAGKRRTYFIDVRATRSNDYYLTLTESKKRFNGDGYDRHKIFLYKEDFNKFVDALKETVDHVKTDLLPEYDFDEFTKKEDIQGDQSANANWQEGDYSESSEDRRRREQASEEEAPTTSEPRPEVAETDSRFAGTDNLEANAGEEEQQSEDSRQQVSGSVGSQQEDKGSADEDAMRWD